MNQPALAASAPAPFLRRAFDWWLAQVKHVLPPTIFFFVNQNHVTRKYMAGRHRPDIWLLGLPVGIAARPRGNGDRFSTMTEVRIVLWPAYETPEWSAAQFLQGIAGTLELFHRSTLSFQQIAGEATGYPVAVFQRIDQAGYKLPIDERIWLTPIRSWCSG